jgi:hypothetical protein
MAIPMQNIVIRHIYLKVKDTDYERFCRNLSSYLEEGPSYIKNKNRVKYKIEKRQK